MSYFYKVFLKREQSGMPIVVRYISFSLQLTSHVPPGSAMRIPYLKILFVSFIRATVRKGRGRSHKKKKSVRFFGSKRRIWRIL